MNSNICKAITERKVMDFTYKSVLRKVERYCYGVLHSGKQGVLAWQITGGSGYGYRLFLVYEIGTISLSDSFAGPRSDYHRGDSRFAVIYAEN